MLVTSNVFKSLSYGGCACVCVGGGGGVFWLKVGIVW